MNLSRLKLRQELLILLFSVGGTGVSGTGIAVALVKRIVEIHDGDILIESQGSGRGCCFCFTLPVRGEKFAT